jgi:hypothetical protein
MNTPSIYDRNVRGVAVQARSNLGVAQHPRVSLRGGNFTLVDAAGTEFPAPVVLHPDKRVPMMMAVIIGANANMSKVFYADAWQPDAGMPPMCFSDNGIAPSANSQEPQAVTCQQCYWNKWGSDVSKVTNKGIKACSDKKKVAVMVIGDTTGLTYELQIPPASLRALGSYIDRVMQMPLPGGSRGADLHDVVTSINFVPGQTGILEFDYLAWTESVAVDPQSGLAYLCGNDRGLTQSPDGGWALAQRVDATWEAGVIESLIGLNDVPWQPNAYVNVNALPGMQHQPASAIPPPAPPAHAPHQGGSGNLPAGAAPSFAGGQLQQQQQRPHPQGAYGAPPGMAPSEPVQAFTQPAAVTHSAVGAAPAPPSSAPPVSNRGRPRTGAAQAPRTVAPAPSRALQHQPQAPAPGNVVQYPGHTAASAPAGAPPRPVEQAIPPFLQRTGPAASAPPANLQPAQPEPASFGVAASAPTPPPGLENALSNAFSLKTET